MECIYIYSLFACSWCCPVVVGCIRRCSAIPTILCRLERTWSTWIQWAGNTSGTYTPHYSCIAHPLQMRGRMCILRSNECDSVRVLIKMGICKISVWGVWCDYTIQVLTRIPCRNDWSDRPATLDSKLCDCLRREAHVCMWFGRVDLD